MTRFEYISIFNGIVVALAIENIASSFHKLLEAGGRVRWHWMAPMNAVGSVIATIGQFWLWWLGRNIEPVNPSVLTFLPGAFTAILLYLVCAATLPDDVPERGLDLKAFYRESRRQFWSLVAVAVSVQSCVSVWNMARHNFDPQIVGPNLPFLIGLLVALGIAISALVFRAMWWHGAGILTMTAGVIFMFGSIRL